MGYNTKYSLDFESPRKMEIIKDLRDTFDSANWCLNSDGKPGDMGKWYDHVVDMETFSLKYPDIVFTLSGQGEENDNIWKKYFQAGKVQETRPIITWPEFDLFKLR